MLYDWLNNCSLKCVISSETKKLKIQHDLPVAVYGRKRSGSESMLLFSEGRFSSGIYRSTKTC